MSNEQPTTFLIDQRIVYPSQGVGRIMEIREKVFNGQKILYYIIYLEFSDMTVMVPVDKVDRLGIRPLVSKEEAETALNYISQAASTIPSDWKLRYQMKSRPAKKRLNHGHCGCRSLALPAFED